MRSLIVLVLMWMALQLVWLGLETRRARRDPRHPSAERVEAILARWPNEARRAARSMIVDRGGPDGARVDVLWWEPRGDAAVAVAVYRDGDAGSWRTRAVSARAGF